MQTYLITANDTDVGKTYVTGLLARFFAAQGKSVQVIKAVDCGDTGDANTALERAGSSKVSAYTFVQLPEPMAPLAGPNLVGEVDLTLAGLLAQLRELPESDIRLIEGAGGVAVPIDPNGGDWRDLAEAVQVDGVIAVVDNRLGAINQSRLLSAYLGSLRSGFVLNEVRTVSPVIALANEAALKSEGICMIGQVNRDGDGFACFDESFFESRVSSSACHPDRPLQMELEQRCAQKTFRELTARSSEASYVNLADNDYLNLSAHPAVIEAAQAALEKWGASSSSSPLVTGYTVAHEALEQRLSSWYGSAPALVWNSGYSANQAVLKAFIRKGDLVLADRLIHYSLIEGILQSGARLIRFQHNDLEHLESLLKKFCGQRRIHLVIESVYSMDGDYPDLQRIAYLKNKYAFNWFLDEAHAVGWFGVSGAGLAEAAGVTDSVDVLTGTLGKALASAGAYTVFREVWMRDYCVNFCSEFIYSTYLPPSSAAAAVAAIDLVVAAGGERGRAQQAAVDFRSCLREQGWEVLGEDSPIVPVVCGDAECALSLADSLLEAGLKVAAIRPPTVPQGGSRIRVSLKSTLNAADYENLEQCFKGSSPVDV